MEWLPILITGLLLLLFVNMLFNLRNLNDSTLPPQLLEGVQPDFFPFVSVLVPARNEEDNIAGCLLSLSYQDYHHYEILVLDDNSTDKTLNIAREIARSSSRIRIIRGKKLPPGWNGKNWACEQLVRKARGEWLLLTDADTVHSPHSISTAVMMVQKNQAHFLTTIPGLLLKTWAEKLLLPIIHFAFAVLVPFHLGQYSQISRLPIGIGPFLLVKRNFLEKIGGYEAIRDEIVDDMALANHVQNNAGRITVIDGLALLKVRFYRSFSEIWRGFSKNAYPAIGAHPYFVPFIIVGAYFLFIQPYLKLWLAIQSGHELTLPLIQVFLISMMKIFLALKFETSFLFGLLHPLSIAIWLLILLNSMRLSLFKKKFEWKERYYPID